MVNLCNLNKNAGVNESFADLQLTSTSIQLLLNGKEFHSVK